MDPTPDPDSNASGRLPYLGLLRFAGPDATTFLQGQLSNDTRRLSVPEPLLAALSTPQGRVVAVLRLLPHSSGVIALLPRELVLPTFERLRKFVLRTKVQIEDLSEQFVVVGLHGSAAAGDLAVADASHGYLERDAIGIGRLDPRARRCWAVGRAADFEKHGIDCSAPPTPQVERDWRLADIRAGVPQIYAATHELYVAQMLNLDLIDGISFTKGCFTGQEIIARTQHLGRIKRRMFRLRLPAGTWAIGQALRLTDGRSGRLIELAAAGGGHEALAVLTIESGSPPDAADGASTTAPVAAIELPLPYALTAPA
jgi:folate-binding protein YgfZ